MGKMYPVVTTLSTLSFLVFSGGTRVFFLWGIEEAKCVTEGEKFKNLLKMADFDHFFLLRGASVGAEPLRGGNAPCPPLDAATASIVL